VELAWAPGEVEGVHWQAVPVDAGSGLEAHEPVGLGGGGVDELPDVDAEAVDEPREAVDERVLTERGSASLEGDGSAFGRSSTVVAPSQPHTPGESFPPGAVRDLGAARRVLQACSEAFHQKVGGCEDVVVTGRSNDECVEVGEEVGVLELGGEVGCELAVGEDLVAHVVREAVDHELLVGAKVGERVPEVEEVASLEPLVEGAELGGHQLLDLERAHADSPGPPT